jgi:hypothetical protein
LVFSPGNEKISRGRSPIDAVHPDRGAPGPGTQGEEASGIGKAGVEEYKKKDNQEDKTIEPRQVHPGAYTEKGLELDPVFRKGPGAFSRGYGPRGSVFSEHGGIIGLPSTPCQRWYFMVIFFK